MLDGMVGYESYKDSGLGWLGAIPSDWVLMKSKYVWREIEDRSERGEEQLLSVSQYHGVVPNQSDGRSESLEGYKRVYPDHLVTNIMLAWMGGLGISDHNGIVSPAYAVYRLRDNHSAHYLGYLYRTQLYLAEFARRSKGVVPSRWRMYTDDFGQVLTLLPPLDTQNRIVSFLNEKTAEIDEAVERKRRLIDLLNEQKAILINRAVTKGLNPDATMKDSGVDWIGEIPAHWGVKRLKFFTEVQAGVTLGKAYPGKLEEFPYLRVANVQAGFFRLDDMAYLPLPPRVAEKYKVRSGDILVTEGGDLDKLGRGTVWQGEIDICLHQNHVFAVRVLGDVATRDFVALCMEADFGRRYFTTTANKTTNLASTNQEKLGNFPVVIPPSMEQQEIFEAGQQIKSGFADAVEVQFREIAALNEFKQILIANAVTGKIKI